MGNVLSACIVSESNKMNIGRPVKTERSALFRRAEQTTYGLIYEDDHFSIKSGSGVNNNNLWSELNFRETCDSHTDEYEGYFRSVPQTVLRGPLVVPQMAHSIIQAI
jgi:hypothetical protein